MAGAKIPPSDSSLAQHLQDFDHQFMGQSGLMRSGAIAETFPVNAGLVANTGILTSGQLFLVAIYIPKDCVVSNFGVVSGTTAAITPTHWWGALYDSNLNLLGQTADQTTSAFGASTEKVVAFQSPITVTKGIYYVGFMMTASVAVISLLGIVSTASTLANLAPIRTGTSTGSLTTTAPSTASALTVSLSTPYFYLS